MSHQNIHIGGNAQGNAFGDQSSVTITNSFNSGIQDATLKQLFDTLVAQLTPLREEMKLKDAKALDEHLAVLTTEAAKPEKERNASALSVSGKGLIEAANTVKDMAGPVIKTASMILKFLGVG